MTHNTPSLEPITLKVTPRRPALLEGFDNTLDILLQMQAPAVAPEGHQRSPLNLALVLDRSGSMDGRPLHEAVRCAQAMIERLRAVDRVALVVYDDKVDTLVPNQCLADKTPFYQALQTVASGGCTNLHGGWLQGAQEVAAQVRAGTLSRVLLLSDGQANAGLTEPDQIATQCAELAAASVSTSTYGLGRSFNEELMDTMARAGQGSAYYGETAEDLMEPFEREFELLNALCAKSLRLTFEMAAGVHGKLLNAYITDDMGTVLPDLAYGSEAWAVIRLKIPAPEVERFQATGQPLLSVMVTARNLEGEALKTLSAGLTLPSLPAQAFQAVSEDERVVRRVGEVEASNLQDQAQKAARRGDWHQVRYLLREVKERSKDNPWLQGIMETLETLAQREDTERFAKEARYSSRNLSSRIAALGESADYEPCAEAAVPVFLRRKREQGKKDS